MCMLFYLAKRGDTIRSTSFARSTRDDGGGARATNGSRSPNGTLVRRVHGRSGRTPERLGEFRGVGQRAQHAHAPGAVHVGQQIVQRRLFGRRLAPYLRTIRKRKKKTTTERSTTTSPRAKTRVTAPHAGESHEKQLFRRQSLQPGQPAFRAVRAHVLPVRRERVAQAADVRDVLVLRRPPVHLSVVRAFQIISRRAFVLHATRVSQRSRQSLVRLRSAR